MIFELIQMWNPQNWQFMMTYFPNWWIMGVMMGLGWLIYLGISIVIMRYIYRDAIYRKVANPAIWAILGLILNLIGLIAYVSIRGITSAPTQESIEH